MQRVAMNLMLLSALVVSPALVGCDKTVSEDKKVEQKSDGTTVTSKEKTTQAPDGSMTKTTEKSVDKP